MEQFNQLKAAMTSWVAERDDTYHKLGVWIENNGFVQGSHGYSEMRLVTIGAQCYVRHAKAVHRPKWRAAQGHFILALRDVGYDAMVMPDHIPRHDDPASGLQGHAFAFGYIKALIHAAGSYS